LQIIAKISIRKCSTLCAVTDNLSLRFEIFGEWRSPIPAVWGLSVNVGGLGQSIPNLMRWQNFIDCGGNALPLVWLLFIQKIVVLQKKGLVKVMVGCASRSLPLPLGLLKNAVLNGNTNKTAVFS
jgi:hypothetical protein